MDRHHKLDTDKLLQIEDEQFAMFICSLFITCHDDEESDKLKAKKILRYLLSKKIINRDNFKHCNTNSYATMSSEEFFIRFKQQPEQLQTELIRIMGEHVCTLTIDDINDILLNANDYFALKSTVKNLTEPEKKQIISFFNKCGILLRINDIFLYQMQVNTMEMAVKDVQIISKLIEHPETDLAKLLSKLDYYCTIIDKEKLRTHSKEISVILDKIIEKPQFQDFIHTLMPQPFPNKMVTQDNDKTAELLTVSLKDKTYINPINTFCKFAVEKGYYSANFPKLFAEGICPDEKISYNESNRISHVYFYNRIKQYSDTDNLEDIFKTLFIKTKGKSKNQNISLKLGGNEGNEDNRTKDFKNELDRLLPDIYCVSG